MGIVEQTLRPDLKSDQHALDVGFAEGSQDREHGAKPEDLDQTRELLELPYPLKRGRNCIFYDAWRRGYDAGYLGRPKPTL